MASESNKIAKGLLQIEAIKLRPENPFKWASGWNSPIYCDNRLTLSYPEIRDTIKIEFARNISSQFPDVECIAGVATAGIPQGAIIADYLNLPFVYVRSSPKGHGMENLVEGKIVPGQKTVVIEDLISTGGSSLNAVKALKSAGFEVLGMLAIFTYGFDTALNNFEEAGIKLLTLTNYNELLEVAISNNYINEKEVESLKAWRKDPANWKK